MRICVESTWFRDTVEMIDCQIVRVALFSICFYLIFSTHTVDKYLKLFCFCKFHDFSLVLLHKHTCALNQYWYKCMCIFSIKLFLLLNVLCCFFIVTFSVKHLMTISCETVYFSLGWLFVNYTLSEECFHSSYNFNNENIEYSIVFHCYRLFSTTVT